MHAAAVPGATPPALRSTRRPLRLPCCSLPRVRSVLLLMRTAGVPLAAVVNYPRIFYHHPANCIAPRLAYLKAHKPGR